MHLQLSWVLLSALIPSAICQSPRPNGAQNPIIPGWNPDPAPLRVGDDYYIATSTFEYYPGVPIYHSKDLVNWELFSHALARPEQLRLYGTPTNGGTWAPSLSHKNGTFYMTTATRWVYDPLARLFPRSFWVSSDDLITWSDPIWAEPWGYDTEIFHDPTSSKDYLNLNSINNAKEKLYGIYQCEVDLSSGLCVGEYRSLWNGTLPVNSTTRAEGPKMFLKDEYYYLLIAEGGTDAGHRATIARSKSPEGPWDPAPNNPILYNGVDPDLTVQSTGHGTIFDTPDGDWYVTYLARRNINGSSPLGRETFISHVEWQDGWPVVNNGQPILLSEPVAGLPLQANQAHLAQNVSYDFSGDPAARGWYSLRTPYAPIYSQGSRAGCGAQTAGSSYTMSDNASSTGLILCPNVYTLQDRDVPAAIFRKQTSLNMTFTTRTLPVPEELPPRGAFGITAYLSEIVHHDIGVSNCRNSSGLCVYTLLYRNGTEERNEVAFEPGENRQIELIIRAEPRQYSLGFRTGGETQWLAGFSSYWMAWSPTGIFVFEGAMFGLFATGEGLPWTAAGPTVGFEETTEIFYAESVPDYDNKE